MGTPITDPTPAIYEMFDRCGLTAGSLLSSSQNMNARITTIRVKLANELRAYMEAQLDEPVPEHMPDGR